MKRWIGFLLCLFAALAMVGTAHAIPALQLYLEGATYDSVTETWELQSTDAFKLWVIGDVGSKGTISDVKLSISYGSAYDPIFSITGSTTGGYGGFTDSSTAGDPGYLQTVDDGSTPLLGDGSSLPNHGEFGTGKTWQEYSLGDFTLTDSYIADFINNLPSPSSTLGQINVYEISVSNVPVGTEFHFDAYDHYVSENGKNKYKFAPFSHDVNVNPVPEPSTILLFGGGLVIMAAYGARRRVQK